MWRFAAVKANTLWQKRNNVRQCLENPTQMVKIDELSLKFDMGECILYGTIHIRIIMS